MSKRNKTTHFLGWSCDAWNTYIVKSVIIHHASKISYNSYYSSRMQWCRLLRPQPHHRILDQSSFSLGRRPLLPLSMAFAYISIKPETRCCEHEPFSVIFIIMPFTTISPRREICC